MLKIECRMCQSKELKIFLDLGFTPLADAFLKEYQLDEQERYYPLRVCTCINCGLAQLDYVVPGEELYRKAYPYLSSTTKTGKEHFHGMAREICKKFCLGKSNFVIDIGSNIGVLLEGFKNEGLKVLGIDPATNIAKLANERCIETWPEFFDKRVARKILKKYGKADVITGTNVFAHVDELDEMVIAVKELLNDGGIFVIEVPYLVDLIEKLEYDTIYHEHLSYISIKPLVRYFTKFNMEVFDVQRFLIHGGTIRVSVCNKGGQKVSKNVDELIKLEEKANIYSLERLKKFEQAVLKQKEDLIDLLRGIKKQGKSIIGLSAPAKGNTMLNFCKIGTDYLDYLTEKTHIKLGLYTPGTHIKIFDDKKILEDMPDYALLLAWNFAEEIIKNMEEYKNMGGKFIIPIPKPKII
ncbi:MAG: class I SAM-dependent methyltransferase [Nanoarchaeota archaeon]